MKQIIKLDKGKYIQLDSYGETRKSNFLESFFVGCVVFGFAAVVAGAMFGGDITKNIPQRIPFVKTVTGY
jgi:hypothetical protein